MNNLFVNVRINCSVDTLNGLNDITKDFESLNNTQRKLLQFNMFKVWQVQEKIEGDLDNSAEHYRDNGFSVAGKNDISIFSSCYGDKRYQATLNYNGEIFKCTARDFKDNSGEGVLNHDGTITWNERYEKRLNSKFKNKPCMDCRILPLCGGGCTQQALEHGDQEYCVHNFDEEEKTRIIVNRFLATIAED